ncbi:MAG: hypothetical protein IJF40_06050 [Clostridia bacterium]|nr:hypothetical protein [Clostridia bacterium]
MEIDPKALESLKDVRIPQLATGKFVPPGVDVQIMKEQKEEYLRKAQNRHDWLVALFGVVGGGVMGFLASLLFWLIEKS